MTPLTIFLLFTLNRALSGVANGLFYGGRKYGVAFVLLAVSTLGICIPAILQSEGWQRALAAVGALACALSMAGLYVSFRRSSSPVADIHLWTLSHQTALAGTVFFAWMSWPVFWALCLAVFPSNALQKIAVNLFAGHPWNHKETNDPSGNTYTIPLLGIKMPRIRSVEALLVLAALSMFGMLFVGCSTPRKAEYTTYTGYAVDSLGNYDYRDSIVIRIPKKKH
jgi:hypothetical protein